MKSLGYTTFSIENTQWMPVSSNEKVGSEPNVLTFWQTSRIWTQITCWVMRSKTTTTTTEVFGEKKFCKLPCLNRTKSRRKGIVVPWHYSTKHKWCPCGNANKAGRAVPKTAHEITSDQGFKLTIHTLDGGNMWVRIIQALSHTWTTFWPPVRPLPWKWQVWPVKICFGFHPGVSLGTLRSEKKRHLSCLWKGGRQSPSYHPAALSSSEVFSSTLALASYYSSLIHLYHCCCRKMYLQGNVKC